MFSDGLIVSVIGSYVGYVGIEINIWGVFTDTILDSML